MNDKARRTLPFDGLRRVGHTERFSNWLAGLHGDEEVNLLGGSSVFGRTLVEREPKSVAARL